MAGGTDAEKDRLLEAAREASWRAGAAILEVYAEEFEVSRKADQSPVTLADHRSEAIIVEALREIAAGIPVIAEELAEASGLPAAAPPLFWLVDPLDGTKEFVRRNGEFSINIGLVEGDRPVLGLIHVPVKDLTYAAAGPGTATRQEGKGAPLPIAARKPPEGGVVVTHSRSHNASPKVDAFLEGMNVAECLVSGSAYKFCLIAEGRADLYPRFGPTMEWDTAAGQAILEAAGGSVTTIEGEPFRYGKPGFLNGAFVARGRQ
jgi:3'(2'), 5'-bisphosphate nucleotidase